MFESPKDVQLEPGSWSLWRTGKKILIFACPCCKKPKIIRQDILSTGHVVGRVRCIERGCKFSENMKLLDWPVGEVYP